MITIKSPEQIEKMRVAGRLTAQVLQAVSEFIKPGITTMQIDDDAIKSRHAILSSSDITKRGDKNIVI